MRVLWSLEELEMKYGRSNGEGAEALPEVQFIQAMIVELDRARKKFPKPLNSHHEARSIILEEFEEYWDEVKKQDANHDLSAMRRELIHCATTCLRAAVDLGLMDTRATPAASPAPQEGEYPTPTHCTCWCCGRECPKGKLWCADCLSHTSADMSLPILSRTYYALNKTACPFQALPWERQ